jgi:hypothetical protein
MKIQVTQQDIDEGIAGKCYDCPIALAIARVLHIRLRVFRTIVIYSFGYLIFLPNCVIQFIDQFDNNEPVQPFEFELDITP